MKNKSIIANLLLILPILAWSNQPTTTIHQPAKNITIMPLADMNIPDTLKQNLRQRLAEEKTKGYYQTNSEYAQFLLNLEKNASSELKAYQSNPNPYDTHLKSSISAIKLAFPVNSLNFLNNKNTIGFAAIGTYINDKKNQGWTGIKSFFTDKTLGVCSYSLMNLSLSQGSVKLNAETTKYIVNNKPSSKLIEGNVKTGFLYNVNWFDQTNMHQLECANMHFNKNNLNKLVNLANQYDKKIKI
jgi:hypothetical protein